MYDVAPIFCPPSSWLHKCYSPEFSCGIKVVVGPTQWGTCIHTVFHVASTSALAYWNNNIAITGPTGYDIVILDALTGSQKAILSGHVDWIFSLTYSLDGVFLVSGSRDGTIKLWDVQTGGIIKTLCGHTGQVYSVSISADNTMIASVSKDRKACLWNIKTGNCSIIERYKAYASTITFSPTNSQLLFLSGDGNVQQWNINGRKVGSPVSGNKVTFSSDGTQFVSWEGGTVTIKKTHSKKIVTKFNLTDGVGYCCFSPNGGFIAVAALLAIYLWDISGPDPYLTQTLTGHSSSITSIVFSSPYNLISVSLDKSIKFWQISVSSADPGVYFTSAPIKSVSLQTRDNLAFSIDEAGVVKVWDILTGCLNESHKTQIEGISHADIQLISDRLIIVWTGVVGQGINVWDVKKGKLQTLSIIGEYTQGLRMIKDEPRVLQLEKDSICVWDIWTGKSVCMEKLKGGGGGFGAFQGGGSEKSAHFDALRMDGPKVLVRFGETSVQGWDFGTPGSTPIQFSETSSNRSHLNFIDVRKWSPDSPVRVEDSVTRKELFQLYGKYAKPSATQWDGQYLIAGYDSGEILILNFNDAFS
jgi:WD40 repeat protein